VSGIPDQVYLLGLPDSEWLAFVVMKLNPLLLFIPGGFGDALLSIVPTSKKSSKKKTSSSSSSSSKKPHSSEQISSSPAKSNGYSPGKSSGSPSDHSRSISPLDLLSGNVKLEPLEKLDIASTLPEISPDNYFKPHLYQSDKTPPESSHDALCNIMTSKNQR
jgi:hypothetical protein